MNHATTEPSAWYAANTTDVAVSIFLSWGLVLQVEHWSGEHSELGGQETWLLIPALLWACGMTLVKFVPVSEPSLTYFWAWKIERQQ